MNRKMMKGKHYQRILFPKPMHNIKDNILKAIEPKLVSINYILSNLLPFTNKNCNLCKRELQSINHLLFACYKTAVARQTLYT